MTAAGTGGLRITVSSDRPGRPAPGLGAWLRQVAPRGVRGEVAVAIVRDEIVRRLNRTYRGRNTPTDVLSFPSGAVPPARRRSDSRGKPLSINTFLGDIVIARGVARRQAVEQGHSPTTEFKILALHGLLHLLGYDHERDAGEMARLERRLRLRGGLREGLTERHDAAAEGRRQTRARARALNRGPGAVRRRGSKK